MALHDQCEPTGSSPSGLVGLLNAWAAVDMRAPRAAWEQHWSAWLGPLDAIALSAALPEIRATRAGTGSSRTGQHADLKQGLETLRADLLTAIRPPQVSTPARVLPRNTGPTPPLPAAWAEDDYGSYRQRYLDIQRRMEWRIDPFRQHCRGVLSQTNGRLARLAALDATLETMLGARTEVLLAKLSTLLERRFHRYRQDSTQTGAAFEQDFQNAMVAELQFRLEPVTGLVEAWRTGA